MTRVKTIDEILLNMLKVRSFTNALFTNSAAPLLRPLN
jgi:hypothetical protein